MQLGIITAILLYHFLKFKRSFSELILALICCPIIYYIFPFKNIFTAWSLLAFVILYFVKKDTEFFETNFERIFILLFWLLVYFLLYFVSLTHSDFYPIGERIRDYAILDSVKNNFSHPVESWLPRFDLNYYLFWYRFGAFFSQLFNLSTAETYHSLVSFTYTALILIYFEFLYLKFKLSKFQAICISLICLLGPNGVGLSFLVNSSWQIGTEWWSMTRVIPGTINEFPSWSFTLGDLHPHFSNLPAVILFFSFLFKVKERGVLSINDLINFILSSLVIIFFWRNANPWDLPWILVSLVIFTIIFIDFRKLCSVHGNFKYTGNMFKNLLKVFLLISLIFSSTNLPKSSISLKFVSWDWITTSRLFLLHWSWPFVLLPISSMQRKWVKLTALLLLFISLLFNLKIIFLLGFILIILIVEIFRNKEKTFSIYLSLIWVFGLLFPEVLFFDDAYGGPNERMNTVFKIYIFFWPILFLSIGKIFEKKKLWKINILLSIITIVSLLFFIKLQLVRRPFAATSFYNLNERIEGLEAIEKTYHGSKDVIEFLKSFSTDSVAIEGTYLAYTWSTSVPTLAGIHSYLGWSNHLNLLTKNYEEVGRRTRNISFIFGSSDCEDKKRLLELEKINILIYGPLEKELFGPGLNFSCLDKKFSKGYYDIYVIN